MIHKLLALTFVMGLLLTSVSQATLIRYDYRGPNFDTPMPLQSPYEDDDHIEGFITIDDAFLDASGSGFLSASNTNVQPWLTDLSFTDGVKTIDFADLPTLSFWSMFLLFSSLDLVSWNIGFVTEPGVPSPVGSLVTFCGDFGSPNQNCGGADSGTAFDEGRDSDGMGGSVSASVDYLDADPPVWNRSVAVPEPTTLALFTLGLAGLGWVQRKKKA